ncbi:MAG TPA: hypothetical protein VK817_22100 [Trebonia sp.]|nr:hypothetical protein [Trebonia sp.]
MCVSVTAICVPPQAAVLVAGVLTGVLAAGVALAGEAEGEGDADAGDEGDDAGLDDGWLDGAGDDAAEVDASGAEEEFAQAASSTAHPTAPRPARTDLVSVTVNPFGQAVSALPVKTSQRRRRL